MPGGGFTPNQFKRKTGSVVSGVAVSTKITDSPGAMLLMPFKATAAMGDSELSFIFQPVISTAVAPVFVTSNYHKKTDLLTAASELFGLMDASRAGKLESGRTVLLVFLIFHRRTEASSSSFKTASKG
jgi:hypothetical protein